MTIIDTAFREAIQSTLNQYGAVPDDHVLTLLKTYLHKNTHLLDPQTAFNQCDAVCTDLVDLIPGSSILCASANTNPISNEVRALGYLTESYIVYHAVLLVDQWVIDLTQRQYDPDCHVPQIYTLNDFRKQYCVTAPNREELFEQLCGLELQSARYVPWIEKSFMKRIWDSLRKKIAVRSPITVTSKQNSQDLHTFELQVVPEDHYLRITTILDSVYVHPQISVLPEDALSYLVDSWESITTTQTFTSHVPNAKTFLEYITYINDHFLDFDAHESAAIDMFLYKHNLDNVRPEISGRGVYALRDGNRMYVEIIGHIKKYVSYASFIQSLRYLGDSAAQQLGEDHSLSKKWLQVTH